MTLLLRLVEHGQDCGLLLRTHTSGKVLAGYGNPATWIGAKEGNAPLPELVDFSIALGACKFCGEGGPKHHDVVLSESVVGLDVRTIFTQTC